jgi:hypothetical protein
MENYKYLRVSEELYERSVKDSADYAEKNMPNVLVFFDESKSEMYSYALQQEMINGYIAEFGVWQGKVVNAIALALPNKKIYGFDSFYGLPEDWNGWELSKGTFNLNGVLPKVLENVELIEGYFEKSLPAWLEKNKDPFSLLIIDSDLYSSAKTILNNIGTKQIKKGTLILFDEYFGYINWRQHEFKAWQEFVKKHEIDYEYLAINHLQALVRIKNIKKP